jgi:hypothetical protein
MLAVTREDLSRVTDPRALSLLKSWHALRGARAMPREEDLRLYRLRQHAPSINIMDSDEIDPMLFRIAVYGSRMFRDDGADYSGFRMKDMPDVGTPYHDMQMRHYAEAAREGTITAHLIKTKIGFQNFDYLRLILPIGNGRVTKLIVAKLLDPSLLIYVTDRMLDRLRRRILAEKHIYARRTSGAVNGVRTGSIA